MLLALKIGKGQDSRNVVHQLLEAGGKKKTKRNKNRESNLP
jgi:hypothetical protein